MQIMEQPTENTFESREWEIVPDKTLRCFVELATDSRYVLPSDLAEMLGLATSSLSNLASGTLKLKVKENTPLRKWMQSQELLPESARRTHYFSGKDAKTLVQYRMEKTRKRSRPETPELIQETDSSQGNVISAEPEQNMPVTVNSFPDGDAYDFGDDHEEFVQMDQEMDQMDDLDDLDCDPDQMDCQDDDADFDYFEDFAEDHHAIIDDDDDIDAFLGTSTVTETIVETQLRAQPDHNLPHLTYPVSFDRRKDYTKKYALQGYSISDNLKREFISLKRFLTCPPVSTNAKPLNDVTVKKRFERVRCFLGFAKDFLGVPADQLTLRLMTVWQPFESFVEYLRIVPQASDATRAEMITGFVMTAKWIYFQQGDRRNPNQIPCIRQAMDIRNRLHNSAKRQRSDKTEDELKSEGKWLQWEDFLKATRDLRKEFLDTRDPGKRSRPTLESARTLHDLVLLTFLSTMPSRSSELRLLESISWSEMMQKPAKMSIKQSVANQKRDFLVKQPNESYWIYLGNWKLFWKKVLLVFRVKFPATYNFN